MEQSNPYAASDIDELPIPRFVPDAVDPLVLKEEVKQAFDQHRGKLLLIGAAFHLLIVAVVLLYFLAPIYVCLLLLPVYPAISFFANIYIFELIKNGRCPAVQWFKHARSIFLFRFALMGYSLPKMVLMLLILVPALYLWKQYLGRSEDNMFWLLPILGAFIGIEVQCILGSFFVMDVNDTFQEAAQNGQILLKSKARDGKYTNTLRHTLWLVFIFYLTLTLSLIYLIPYQYVHHAVYYLAATQSYRKTCLETPDY